MDFQNFFKVSFYLDYKRARVGAKIMFTNLSKTKKVRSSRGTAIELTLGITLLIPILLMFIDCGFLVLGATLNDSICRNAARAASSGDPADADRRIESVLARSRSQNGPIRNVRVAAGYPINEGVNNNNIGPVGGQITVRTTMDVQLPAPIQFINISQVTLSAQQTFPYTFVRRGTEPNPN